MLYLCKPTVQILQLLISYSQVLHLIAHSVILYNYNYNKKKISILLQVSTYSYKTSLKIFTAEFFYTYSKQFFLGSKDSIKQVSQLFPLEQVLHYELHT